MRTELIFDQGAGELLPVGNAGNVVTSTALASLEYAVTYLGVSLLMVLGHSNCRAVGTASQAQARLLSVGRSRLERCSARALDCYRMILYKPKEAA